MIKFVEYKDEENPSTVCRVCCKQGKKTCSLSDENSKIVPHKCKGGYFVNVKRIRPRMGKHERLLRALLKDADIMVEDGGQSFCNFKLPLKLAHTLSEIKQAMDKKGGGR